MSKYREMTHEEVLAECKKYMNDEHLAFVESAYEFAKNAHEGQFRVSGQPYIIHPTQVAGTLATLRLDPDTVAAGYLHDTVEDTPVTNDDIKEKFGKDVAFIVDGVTKLSKIQYKSKSHEEYLADNHRKMLIAMAKDLRVIMVKLADRLHNMHTLDHLRPDKQRRIADETLDIYAPLADRLGIGTIKWELEDMSLHYLNPQQYYRIVNLMQSKRSEREGYIADAIKTLKQTLDSLGIEYEIYGRPKHIYSIYKKMVNKHKDFSEIYDLLAVRVIVKSVRDCYAVLGAFIPSGSQCLVVLKTILLFQRLTVTNLYIRRLLGLAANHLKFRLELKQCIKLLNTVLLHTGHIKKALRAKLSKPMQTRSLTCSKKFLNFKMKLKTRMSS